MGDITRIGKEVELDTIVSGLVKSLDGKKFPEAKDIKIAERYVDPFAFPKGCDLENYAYAWVDLSDDIQRTTAINNEYYLLVTRMNHPKISDMEFVISGAVVRRGMALMYRPIDIEQIMRRVPVSRHLAGRKGVSEKQNLGKLGDISPINEETAGRVQVVTAYESPGEEGFHYVDTGGEKE